MFDADNLATQVQISKINEILNRDKSAYPPYGLYNDTLTKDKAEEWLREHTDNHFSEKYIPQNADFDDEAKFLSQELYQAICSEEENNIPVASKELRKGGHMKRGYNHYGKVYLYGVENIESNKIIFTHECDNVSMAAKKLLCSNSKIFDLYTQCRPTKTPQGYIYVHYKKFSPEEFSRILDNAKKGINTAAYTLAQYDKETGKCINTYLSQSMIEYDKLTISKDVLSNALRVQRNSGKYYLIDLGGFYWKEYFCHEEILKTLPNHEEDTSSEVEVSEDTTQENINNLDKYITEYDDVQSDEVQPIDITIADISAKTFIPEDKIRGVVNDFLALLYQNGQSDKDEEIKALREKIKEQEEIINEQKMIIDNIKKYLK